MIELKPVELHPVYRKKFNENSTDFVQIYKDGVKVSDTFYRVGGLGHLSDISDLKTNPKGYFMLIKHVEAMYDDDITTDPDRKLHLESQWTILNQDGREKVNFESFKTPYLVGGVVYVLDKKYYNIETGEFYCSSYTLMKTKEFIFLDNAYDKDKSKRGVLKINKKDGTFELFNSN